MSAKRSANSTSIRLPAELHAALRQAADERDVSVNWLVTKAVQDFLPRLIPADRIQWAYEHDELPVRTMMSGQLVMEPPDLNQAVAHSSLPPVEPG